MKKNSLFLLFLTISMVSNLSAGTMGDKWGSFLKDGHLVFSVGGFQSRQGLAQHIDIQDLIGDDFSVNDKRDYGPFFGIGYFVNNLFEKLDGISLGVNAFYLGKSRVSGLIDQESMFTNLAYSYDVSHFNVYAVAKGALTTFADKYVVSLEGGIGPNFIHTSNYRDWSVDGGITLPDNAFYGHTNTTLSATVAINVKLLEFWEHKSLECGYRFFYLGKGELKGRSNQLLNNLQTGTVYANALACAVTI